MTDELDRGLEDAAVAQFEVAAQPSTGALLTEDDWNQSAVTFAELADPAVMEAAWGEPGTAPTYAQVRGVTW